MPLARQGPGIQNHGALPAQVDLSRHGRTGTDRYLRENSDKEKLRGTSTPGPFLGRHTASYEHNNVTSLYTQRYNIQMSLLYAASSYK